MKISRQLAAVNISISSLNGFKKGIVDEYVLLLSLYEKIALIADVTQETTDIQFIFTLYLLQHGIQHDISS